MQRLMSYVKLIIFLRLVTASRSLTTLMSFSGHAIAHRSQAVQSVSPVSGLTASRGCPR
jgi:hypothetical protein